MHDSVLLVHPNRRQTRNQSITTVKIEWCRRDRKNFAFIIYESPLQACCLVVYSHQRYRFGVSKDNLCSVFVGKVPCLETEEELRSEVTLLVASDAVCGGGGVPFEVRRGYDKIFNDNSIGMAEMKTH